MIAVSISSLSNADLFKFGSQVNELLLGVSIYGIEHTVDDFKTKFKAYQESYEQTSAFAEKVLIKDSKRDNYFIALITHVRNFKYHPDKHMRDIADQLLAVLNKRGDKVYQLSYSSETAALKEMINTIEQNHVEDIVALGAMVWFNLLKEAECAFELVMDDYVDKKKKTVKLDAATGVRKDLEASIRKLLSFLPLQYEITRDSRLNELVEKIQELAYKF